MRQTLHEYLFEQFNKPLKMSETVSMKFKRCFDYAELTGRKPNIEDFIGENAIFKGDWECLGFHGDVAWIQLTDRSINIHLDYDRIEDFPREIEFKDEICG